MVRLLPGTGQGRERPACPNRSHGLFVKRFGVGRQADGEHGSTLRAYRSCSSCRIGTGRTCPAWRPGGGNLAAPPFQPLYRNLDRTDGRAHDPRSFDENVAWLYGAAIGLNAHSWAASACIHATPPPRSPPPCTTPTSTISRNGPGTPAAPPPASTTGVAPDPRKARRSGASTCQHVRSRGNARMPPRVGESTTEQRE